MTWQELVSEYGWIGLVAVAASGVAVYVYVARRSTDAADASDDHCRYRKP
jgi:hypothetical protein